METNMKLKAIKIDASTGLISEVVVNDWRDISKHIGCDLFTAVRISATESLYVDDEGLINGTTTFFKCKLGEGGFLAGNGLVLGLASNGDSVSTKLTVQDVIEKLGVTAVYDGETKFAQTTKTVSSLN